MARSYCAIVLCYDRYLRLSEITINRGRTEIKAVCVCVCVCVCVRVCVSACVSVSVCLSVSVSVCARFCDKSGHRFV